MYLACAPPHRAAGLHSAAVPTSGGAWLTAYNVMDRCAGILPVPAPTLRLQQQLKLAEGGAYQHRQSRQQGNWKEAAAAT